jgi:hypothetical protein
MGTANFLIGLGVGAYLEIIGRIPNSHSQQAGGGSESTGSPPPASSPGPSAPPTSTAR